MTDLTRRMYKMRGIDINEHATDLAPRRVRRRMGLSVSIISEADLIENMR